MPKFELLDDYLKRSIQNIGEYFANRIPKFELLDAYLKQCAQNIGEHFADREAKFESHDAYLKQCVHFIEEQFVNRVPKLTCAEENGTYKITLTGFSDHHTTFKVAFKRLINLFNPYNSRKEFYQRYEKRFIGSIKTNLFEVNVKTYCWKQYTKILIELLKEKNIEYVNRFNDSIRAKAKSLIEQSIRGTSNPPWIELRLYTDEILEEKPFENQIHQLKNRALEEFIKQNISFQRLKTDRIPTKRSIDTIEYCIN